MVFNEERTIEDYKENWEGLSRLANSQNVLLGSEDCDEVLEILSLVPKELKHKKGIPSVIEYQGRRYVLDHGNK